MLMPIHDNLETSMATYPLVMAEHSYAELHQVSVSFSADEIALKSTQTLIQDMTETMHSANGVGLAAIQIGVPKRLLVAELSFGTTVFINPKILTASSRMIEGEEGCLSIPNVFGLVARHKKIKVKAFDEHGSPVRHTLSDLDAIILQHEIDHLDGILFTDKTRLIRYTKTTPSWEQFLHTQEA